MSSTLSEGVRVPDIGSTSWGADVNFNWGLLNTALANISGNVKTNVENTWTAPQTFTETISGSIDGVAARAVGDEDGNNIKAALASKAADNSVVHLAGAETITGDKTWTGSNAFNSILPNATNAYSLGSSSYQWASVYAQNYYYNGTAWGLDKLNRWSQRQELRLTELEDYTLPSSDVTTDLLSWWGTTNFRGGFGHQYYTNGDEGWRLLLSSRDTDNNEHLSAFRYKLNRAGTDSCFYGTGAQNFHLGTSSTKWKTLNGINPGALSLPNKDSIVDITSEFADLTGGDIYYIPPADGWVCITADTELYCAVVSSTHRTVFWRQSASATSISTACVTIPVKYNLHLLAKIKSTGAITATFYPCLGNV